MEGLTSASGEWELGKEVELESGLELYVTEVDTYLPSPAAYSYWAGRMQLSPTSPLFLQDAVLLDRAGDQTRMLLPPRPGPALDTDTAVILPGGFITLTSAARVAGPHGSAVLLAATWQSGSPFPLKWRSEVRPVWYPVGWPLLAPHSSLLCPWTRLSLQWRDPHQLPRLDRLGHPALARLQHTPAEDSLARLAEAWPQSSRRPTLLLRVFAKSKERLVVQPGQQARALLNLLVADNTAYCVLTCWQEAVAALQAVGEGDILVLGGRYSLSRGRQVQQGLAYRLGPKVRGAGTLLPIMLEVKLTPPDLGAVWVVEPAAIAPFLPPLLTRFLPASQLVGEKLGAAAGRLVDLAGLVVQHSRWEREPCSHAAAVGQLWARVWLLVMDGTHSQPVPVKLWVCLERWDAVEGALPGEGIILTNLLVRTCNTDQREQLAFLESSNETAVFSGEAALDSRYSGAEPVQKFRAWLYDQQPGVIARLLEERGGLGGTVTSLNPAPALAQQVEGELRTRAEVEPVLAGLVVRGAAHLLVTARVGRTTGWQVEEGGGLVPGLVEQLAEPWDEGQLPVLGSTEPRTAGLLRPVPSSRPALLSALARHCHLGGGAGGPVGEREVALQPCPARLTLLTLLLEDCTLQVQAGLDWWEQVRAAAGTGLATPLLLCLELWRGEDGVEVRLGHLVLPQQDSQAGGEEEDVISSTLELAEQFRAVN